MGIKQAIQHFYETKYKALMLITLLLIPASLGVMLASKAMTGEYFQKGISLKGGDSYLIPIDHDIDLTALQDALTARNPAADITVRGISDFGRLTGLNIEAADITQDQMLASLKAEGITVTPGSYTVESMGSSLGQSFYEQTLVALVFAFVFMAIVIFITFRIPLPSFFVVLAVFSTTVETLAVVSILGVKMSTAGIAALLMLIGYSVDTDILLTTRALYRKDGPVMGRIYAAMKTGVVMTLTALVTTFIAYLFSSSDVIQQIMLILTIGLVFDLLNTWIQNVGVIRLYLERKERKEASHGQN
jgi:preprotein translocase subunit SecF